MSASDGFNSEDGTEKNENNSKKTYSLIFVAASLKCLDMTEYVVLINDVHRFSTYSLKFGSGKKQVISCVDDDTILQMRLSVSVQR